MEAFLYQPLQDNKVRCDLCGHHCIVKPGKTGICRVRENRDGNLFSKVYGKLIARHVDPIEKKPFFHFLPGSLSYSIAAAGCNFTCRFCQNADIAQMPADHHGAVVGEMTSPESVVDDASQKKCRSIAFTYTEPTVFFEFAHHTACLAHEKGIKNIFVTNGYMSEKALTMISPFLDAANVDLKAFSDDFYKRYCGARLEPVKETLKRMKSLGLWLEVTTLIIPGLNDGRKELTRLANFIATALGEETPWHVSRFHPAYKLTDRPVTPVNTLLSAREIGKKAGLRYVYTGNVPGRDSEKTFCRACGKLLIDRVGFQLAGNNIENGRCSFCKVPIDGIMS